MATQFGYFLIADITGYTAYLSASELDHAQKSLTALLNLLIKQTKPPLIISRLAGDAVISYALSDKFIAGQTFVEMLEDTYVGFRRMVELMVRNATCPCNACRNIGSLDLKFFVHYGEFAVQKLDAHDELVGSDVNLIHRLLKNSVPADTGIRAYTLFTDAAVRQLGLVPEIEGFVPHNEAYEHLGTVATWIEDMHPVWEAKRAALEASVAPASVLFSLDADVAAPPEAVWDFVVQPEHFNVLLGGDYTKLSKRAGGRVTIGSVYQCYHGEHPLSNTVLGWRPFEQVVVEFTIPLPIPGVALARIALTLTPTATGTHLHEDFGKAEGALLIRAAADAGMRARRELFLTQLKAFAAHVEAEAAGRNVTPVGIADETVGAAARESLTAG
jgi:uncharacterized protein YndB with AHSA1/START domain